MSNERGATALEYGFMISFVGAAVAMVVGPLGEAVAGLFFAGVDSFP